MPDVIRPEEGSTGRPVGPRRRPEELHADQWDVADVRYVGTLGRGPAEDPATRRGSGCGCGCPSELPDDPFWHRAAFTYLSRHDAVGAALSPHGVQLRLRAMRSSPRSTTRCGSTGRSGPTSGGSTTRCRRRRPAAAGWSLARVFTAGRQPGRLGRPGGRDPRRGRPRREHEPDRGARRPARPRGARRRPVPRPAAGHRPRRACTAARSPRRR